jgi:2-polyprenyl-3-methyl-5-hydroxy-6-metoxy-1,4-benzoquinol methylase
MAPEREQQHYSIKTGPFSSHSQIVRALGSGSGRSVLDIGCAHGELGSDLMNRGWTVTGVEPYENDAELARMRGMRVINAPIERALSDIEDVYDAVILADVLEHLVDPWSVLERVKGHLSPSGIVVASIPNVAHFYVRLSLLMGRFNYARRGILDQTHLRFFTRRSVLSLFNHAGLRPIQLTATPIPIELIFSMSSISRLGRIVHRINVTPSIIWPGAFAYQFIVVAVGADDNTGGHVGMMSDLT